MESIPKPDELLALHDITAELFETLQAWFQVPDSVSLALADIDSAVTELGDPVMIAAMAMRKLQALRLLAQPGVRTSTDVVVAIVQDLDRALLQAPTMRLRRVAEQTDWDAEFAGLFGEGGSRPASAEDTAGSFGAADGRSAGQDAAFLGGAETADGLGSLDGDAQEVRFQELHGALHRALRAVVEASDGEIRYLI